MMDDDATHAPRVPTKLRTKRGATKRMSELCALDDLGRPSEEAPNASTMDADDAPTSMNAPADAVDTLNTDLAEHNEASLPSPAPFSRDASAMPPPRPPARVGSLPHLGLHIHIPSNPATPTDDKPASAKSSYLSQEESQEEHVPPVTPATALTVLPLHAAVAAGNVAAVREWLDARVPAGDAAAKKPALGETTSTPEWPPRPVRDILGPGSESREPWGAKTSPGMPGDAPVPGDVPGDRDAAARLGEMARARAAGVAPPPVGRESDRSSAGGEGRRGPVDVRNEHGNTALAVAAALEDASAAEATAALLLERGASPLALSGGWTPLHWAAQQGNTDALKKMAAWEGGRGVNARASDTGDTPLMVAAAAGRVDCCEALLAAGAEALATNASGVGVLACAASRVSKGSRLKVRSATRAALLRLEPKLRVLVLHHADCDAHVSMKPHQESPERIAAVLETCARAAATGALPEHETVSSSTFEPAQFEHLRRCHSEEYIGVITELGERVAGTPVAFTPYYQGLKGKKQKKKELSDTFFSPGTMAAALRAAGGVVHAVERVLTDQARTAFVCVRPPGHHAGTDGATAGAPSSGFSILNNAMIGTRDADGKVARIFFFCSDVFPGGATKREGAARTTPARSPSRLASRTSHAVSDDWRR
jgi:ankyrin repeat protein